MLSAFCRFCSLEIFFFLIFCSLPIFNMMVKIDGRREEERGTHTANADACSYSSRLVRLTVISVCYCPQLVTTFFYRKMKKK